MTPRRRCGGFALALLLCGAAAGWAQDDDTEAAEDDAVGRCVTRCESQHTTCTAAASAKAAECERQTQQCNAGCTTCTRMNGPLVVQCVNDCRACQARLTASSCNSAPAGTDACERDLASCLERCGP